MPKLILSRTQQDVQLAWAAARCNDDGADWNPGSEALAVVDSDTGKIRAVMVINGFIEDFASVHFASDGGKTWASRYILAGLFGYLFVFKGLNRVISITDSTNTSVLKLWIALGFRIEGQIRKSQDGRKQSTVATMFASECRWISPERE